MDPENRMIHFRWDICSRICNIIWILYIYCYSLSLCFLFSSYDHAHAFCILFLLSCIGVYLMFCWNESQTWFAFIGYVASNKRRCDVVSFPCVEITKSNKQQFSAYIIEKENYKFVGAAAAVSVSFICYLCISNRIALILIALAWISSFFCFFHLILKGRRSQWILSFDVGHIFLILTISLIECFYRNRKTYFGKIHQATFYYWTNLWFKWKFWTHLLGFYHLCERNYWQD